MFQEFYVDIEEKKPNYESIIKSFLESSVDFF